MESIVAVDCLTERKVPGKWGILERRMNSLYHLIVSFLALKMHEVSQLESAWWMNSVCGDTLNSEPQPLMTFMICG